MFNSRRVIHNTGAADGYGSIPHVFNVGMVIVEGVAHCHFCINLTTLEENRQIVADIRIQKHCGPIVFLVDLFLILEISSL